MAADAQALPAGIAILGPTGAGKSALAMRLAAELPVEIVSVDSAQVYRGLDIGTAKPSAEEQRAVRHHLIDIRDPEQVYSAGEFRADVLALLPQIAARGRVPLLVGGTMLYFRALFRGIAALPTAAPDVRAAIDARAAERGWPALHAELAQQDPQAAARIHPHDAQRIQRALEVIALSGRPLHAHWQEQAASAGWEGWRFVLLEPARRADLHAVLERRLAAMLAQGFETEVRALLARPGLAADAPALRLVGYRQLAQWCTGHATRAEAEARALHATRQLAKRQLTWLRSPQLLPDGVMPLRGDPFDAPTTERITRDLIKAKPSP